MPDAPRRIQRRRVKGWRMPAGAVCVTRPGKWGNPYVPGPAIMQGGVRFPKLTIEDCVGLFERDWLRRLAAAEPYAGQARAELEHLRGRDLACWCKPGTPCHADVLLKLANAPRVCEAA